MSDKGLKIIIVDDDADDHFLFKDAFMQLNIPAAIIQLFSGVELLEYLKKNKKTNSDFTEIVVMDINMPTMNGIVALSHLKQDQVFKDIPVFILSTTKEESDYKKCMELGAVNFFTKPNNAKDFHGILSIICTPVLNTDKH